MNQRKCVHLFFPSDGIAGCEKRMLTFWLKSRGSDSEYDFKLVIRRILFESICLNEELSPISQYQKDIYFLDDYGWDGVSKIEYSKAVKRYMKENNRDDIYHFIMYPPLFQLFRRVRSVFTFPANSLSWIKRGLKRTILYYSFFKLSAIDVLDPGIYAHLKKKSLFKKKVYLTKNSFVNVDSFPVVRHDEKKNSILFLGRFDWQKQVVDFVRSIPAIHAKLLSEKVEGIKFYVLGYGEDESKVLEIISRPEFKEIDIIVQATPNPLPYLLESKVFLSLQIFTNYPSKSLLEAIAAGCLPVVTDVGSTRMIADESFSTYIPASFTDAQISEAILSVFKKTGLQFDETVSLAKQFVREHFKFEEMASYYFELYKKTDRK